MNNPIRPLFHGWSATCDGPDGPPKQRWTKALTGEPVRPPLSAQAKRISSALDELAAMGSSICTLLAAVDKGASINIGPVGDAEGTISAAMYQNTGPRPRYETARAAKVADVVAQLADKWGKP